MFLVLTFHWYIIPNAKHIRIQDSLQTIDFCSTNAGSDESVNSNINYEKVKRELHSLLSFVVDILQNVIAVHMNMTVSTTVVDTV